MIGGRAAAAVAVAASSSGSDSTRSVAATILIFDVFANQVSVSYFFETGGEGEGAGRAAGGGVPKTSPGRILPARTVLCYASVLASEPAKQIQDCRG